MIPHGRAPQQPGPDAYSTQAQFLEMRQQIATLQVQLRVISQGVLSVELTTTQIQDFFDSSGAGKAGLGYAGWAIANGNNGTPNLTPAFTGTTPLVYLHSF